jgi:hypothetical protein
MTPRDFAYWLQGYFEIDAAGTVENALTLSAAQRECVLRHAALVYTTHPADPLVRSIEAVLEKAPEAVPLLLSSYFVHVVDPQHPEPAKANAIHHGGKPGGPLVARC